MVLLNFRGLEQSKRHETPAKREYNYFSASEMLKPGLHQYSYSAGVPIVTSVSGVRTYDQTLPTYSVFHRYGFTDKLTLGLNVQGDNTVTVGGTEILISSKVGYFKIAPSLSFPLAGSLGQAASIQYLFSDRRGNGALRTFTCGLSEQSTNYSQLGLYSAGGVQPVVSTGLPIYQILANYSAGLSKTASLAASGTYQLNQLLDNSNATSFTVTVGVTKRWTNGISLSGSLTNSRSARGLEELGVLAFLNWNMIEERQTIAASANSATQNSNINWSYNPSSGADTAAYGANFASMPAQQSFTGSINYTGNRSRETFSYNELVGQTGVEANGSPITTSSQNALLQVASALVYAGGDFAISRPVTNSFAIINPIKSLSGHSLVLNADPKGRYIAESNFFGAAVDPEIGSYSLTRLVVGANDLTPGLSLPRDHMSIFPHYKSGYAFDLGTDATVYLTIRVRNSDGTPVNSSAGRVIDLSNPNAEPLLVFTNRKGIIRSEGFKPGNFRLILGEQEAHPIDFTIPDTAKDEYDMGTLTVGGK